MVCAGAPASTVAGTRCRVASAARWARTEVPCAHCPANSASSGAAIKNAPSNPLGRACDRVEAAFAAGLLGAFLIAAPLLALFAGQWAHGTSVRAQRAALATRHLVPATVLAGAPAQTIYCCATVRVRWTAPDGTRRTGWVPAPADAWAGSNVRVWVDRSGRRTGPPLTDSQVANRVILAAVAAPTARI